MNSPQVHCRSDEATGKGGHHCGNRKGRPPLWQQEREATTVAPGPKYKVKSTEKVLRALVSQSSRQPVIQPVSQADKVHSHLCVRLGIVIVSPFVSIKWTI
jgi:hypothetical protein